MRAKTNSYFSLLTGFAIGVILTAVAFGFARLPRGDQQGPALEGELHLGQRDFINPLIDCPQMPEGASPKKNQIQGPLEELINDLYRKKQVEKVSVAFRDLNNGPAFSIQVDEPFMAASLLKVPIAITLYKKSNVQPGLMNERLKLNANLLTGWQQYKVLGEPLVPGTDYRIEELIQRMLVQSDNQAAALLLSHTQPTEVIEVLREMGVPLIHKEGDWWITVGEYGSLFRILYNSTFLNQQLSNTLLSLLNQAQPTGGLVTGVDSGVPIAHKFGERKVGALQQFHDCGIVYYPRRPYLLCIMTRGSDIKQQEKAIEAMSRLVFEQVKKQTQ